MFRNTRYVSTAHSRLLPDASDALIPMYPSVNFQRFERSAAVERLKRLERTGPRGERSRAVERFEQSFTLNLEPPLGIERHEDYVTRPNHRNMSASVASMGTSSMTGPSRLESAGATMASR